MDEKTLRDFAEKLHTALGWSKDKMEDTVEAGRWIFMVAKLIRELRYKLNEKAAWTQLYIAYTGTQNWGMLASAEQTAAWVDQAIAERRKRYPAPGAEELAKPAEPETPAAS